VDRAIDAAAAEQRLIRRVDDGVDRKRRDVGDHDLDPAAAGLGCQRRVKLAPDVAYDTPNPGTAGIATYAGVALRWPPAGDFARATAGGSDGASTFNFSSGPNRLPHPKPAHPCIRVGAMKSSTKRPTKTAVTNAARFIRCRFAS
jgi:hypothetical protein